MKLTAKDYRELLAIFGAPILFNAIALGVILGIKLCERWHGW